MKFDRDDAINCMANYEALWQMTADEFVEFSDDCRRHFGQKSKLTAWTMPTLLPVLDDKSDFTTSSLRSKRSGSTNAWWLLKRHGSQVFATGSIAERPHPMVASALAFRMASAKLAHSGLPGVNALAGAVMRAISHLYDISSDAINSTLFLGLFNKELNFHYNPVERMVANSPDIKHGSVGKVTRIYNGNLSRLDSMGANLERDEADRLMADGLIVRPKPSEWSAIVKHLRHWLYLSPNDVDFSELPGEEVLVRGCWRGRKLVSSYGWSILQHSALPYSRYMEREMSRAAISREGVHFYENLCDCRNAIARRVFAKGGDFNKAMLRMDAYLCKLMLTTRRAEKDVCQDTAYDPLKAYWNSHAPTILSEKLSNPQLLDEARESAAYWHHEVSDDPFLSRIYAPPLRLPNFGFNNAGN